VIFSNLRVPTVPQNQQVSFSYVASGATGRGFESLQAYQLIHPESEPTHLHRRLKFPFGTKTARELPLENWKGMALAVPLAMAPRFRL